MSRRFSAQHTASGFSAMGGNLSRPRLMGAKTRTIADSIAHARRVALNQMKASKKK
jgi:hypothetical protein